MRSQRLVWTSILGLMFVLGCGPADGTGEVNAPLGGKADKAGGVGVAPAMEHVYELLAEGTVTGLSAMDITAKRGVLDQALDAIIAQVALSKDLTLQVGTNGMDRLNFPPVDLDMDGAPDEVGTKLELSSSADGWILASTDRAHGVALRWSIVAYSQGETVKVVIGVPETFVRLYFRGEASAQALENVAKKIHADLREVVHLALKDGGYATQLDAGIPGTEMGEATIAQIEGQNGPITGESIAPSITLTGVAIGDVVTAIEAAFKAPRVPDLNQDGVVDQADQGVLPGAFMQYLMGQMTFEQMAGMMSMGPQIWGMGGTFQQWAVPRTLDLSTAQAGAHYVVELCQPFYANTALSTGLHHIPSMPCAVTVWEEGNTVQVSLLDPAFIFGYLFTDAGPQMPPAMQALFAVFPHFVYNEMAGVVNASMQGLGLPQTLAFHALPGA